MSHVVRTIKKLLVGRNGNRLHSTEMCCRTPEQFPSAATILNNIGDDWHCWRLRRESDRAFAFRLAVHLETLGIAIEDDMERVLSAEKEIVKRSNEDE